MIYSILTVATLFFSGYLVDNLPVESFSTTQCSTITKFNCIGDF